MKMTREEAKRYIKDQEPTFLQEAPKKLGGHASYICPVCNNGSKGKTGTGIRLDTKHTQNGKRYTCFACGFHNSNGASEDIIGLWKLANHVTSDKEAFEGLYNYYGLDVEDERGERMEAPKPKKTAPTQPPAPKTEEPQKPEPDRMDYFKQCQARVGETDYFTQRGLPKEAIDKFMLGYDTHYYASAFHEYWQAAIIPTGKGTYIARNTDTTSPNRYCNSPGERPVYRLNHIAEATKPIIVVEGEIDALSIMAVGGEAVALGGAGGKGKLIDYLKANKPKQPIILALDNDEAGKKQQDGLVEELAKIEGLAFHTYNIYKKIKNSQGKECKDANEALQANRQALEAVVGVVNQGIKAIKRAEYMKNNSVGGYIEEFMNGIAESVNTSSIPTGFKRLDKVLDGGLYEGLYIVGAISSLGKSTFVLQIADQLAQVGKDVLIFALEMSRTELMSKSISRHTLQYVLEHGGDVKNAKTARGITDGTRYFRNEAEGIRGYSQEELNLIDTATEEYSSYASDHVFITEGLGNVGIETIRKKVLEHVEVTGNTPVIIVDYLQILAPYNEKASDKQNTDKAVLELKRISRDLKTPVIAISSFNRDNYKNAVGMEAFKESGAIEYSSDVLIGLQLEGVGQEGFNATKAKKANPRKIELVILKNRNGSVGDKVQFDYYKLFNYYEEKGVAKEDKEQEGWSTVATTTGKTEPKSKKAKATTKAKPKTFEELELIPQEDSDLVEVRRKED